jgi:hypothetical protein
MCFGVMIASYGEIEFDTLGFIFQMLSITAEAARLVATQQLLQVHLPRPANPLISISLFAPFSLLFLLPVALFKEPAALAHLYQVSPIVLGNTLTAFTLNIAVVILVGQTSGLTLTLAGIVKDILLIAASIWIFNSPITPIQVRERGERAAAGSLRVRTLSPLTPHTRPTPPASRRSRGTRSPSTG